MNHGFFSVLVFLYMFVSSKEGKWRRYSKTSSRSWWINILKREKGRNRDWHGETYSIESGSFPGSSQVNRIRSTWLTLWLIWHRLKASLNSKSSHLLRPAGIFKFVHDGGRDTLCVRARTCIYTCKCAHIYAWINKQWDRRVAFTGLATLNA